MTKSADPDLVARVRQALVDVAREAYEDAGARGLCAEGRWEAALDALRSADLESLLKGRPDEKRPAGGAGAGRV